MSGAFAVPLVLKNPEVISGFVPVAATMVKKLKDVNWNESDVMSLYIWGENDALLGTAGSNIFKNMTVDAKERNKAANKKNGVGKLPKAQREKILARQKFFIPDLYKIKKAGHQCYIDRPVLHPRPPFRAL